MRCALRGSAFTLLAACLCLLAGCESSSSTHRLPAYEPPIARTDYQNVRTTAYTDTEADHLAYTNHNALGGILHDAGPPLSSGTLVAAGGPLPNSADEAAQDIGGFRTVSNDAPEAHPATTARPVVIQRPAAVVPAARPVAAARPAASAAQRQSAPAAEDDNPPWMKEYLRRKQLQQQQPSQRQGDSRAIYYETDATPVYGSAAADWSRWPVGTIFRIESTGQMYKVDDYGWALAGRNTIDLYKSTRTDMNAWGVRHVPIHVLQWGSREESLRLLERHQGYKHIRRMVLELEGHDREAAELE